MNTGHAVGCAALRGGVPCTCWLKPLQPKITRLQCDAEIKVLNRRIHELTVEWRGLQDMASDQRNCIIWLKDTIALTGEASPQD